MSTIAPENHKTREPRRDAKAKQELAALDKKIQGAIAAMKQELGSGSFWSLGKTELKKSSKSKGNLKQASAQTAKAGKRNASQIYAARQQKEQTQETQAKSAETIVEVGAKVQTESKTMAPSLSLWSRAHDWVDRNVVGIISPESLGGNKAAHLLLSGAETVTDAVKPAYDSFGGLAFWAHDKAEDKFNDWTGISQRETAQQKALKATLRSYQPNIGNTLNLGKNLFIMAAIQTAPEGVRNTLNAQLAQNAWQNTKTDWKQAYDHGGSTRITGHVVTNLAIASLGFLFPGSAPLRMAGADAEIVEMGERQ